MMSSLIRYLILRYFLLIKQAVVFVLRDYRIKCDNLQTSLSIFSLNLHLLFIRKAFSVWASVLAVTFRP